MPRSAWAGNVFPILFASRFLIHSKFVLKPGSQNLTLPKERAHGEPRGLVRDSLLCNLVADRSRALCGFNPDVFRVIFFFKCTLKISAAVLKIFS